MVKIVLESHVHTYIKLFNFEIQKCGQILCAHKPYFLIPGHIFTLRSDQEIVQTFLKVFKKKKLT